MIILNRQNPTMGNSDTLRPRTVHLVDVENLLGTSAPTPADVRQIQGLYSRAAGLCEGDHVIIATGSCAAPSAWFGWNYPGVRRLLRRGVDGADRELLGVIDHEGIAARFDRVVIGSGDGILADACAELQAAGCTVLVVCRRGSISSRLRMSVRDIRYLPHSPTAPATVHARGAA